MLSRLFTHLKLILLALALVIVPGALVIMGQSDWAHRRLQEVVTRQLAQSLGREVSVGPISGNLLVNINIEGLAIAETKRLADGAMVTADRVQVSYDLVSVLHGHLAPLASIRSVDVWNPHLHVVHEPSGLVNLQHLLGPPHLLPVPKRFRGKLVVHNATALYEDYARYVKTPPLQLHVAGVEMTADLRQITRMVIDTTARVTDGRASDFAGRVIYDRADRFCDVSGKVNGIDAAWFMRTFGLQQGYTVTGGRANVSGYAYRVPRPGQKPFIDFSGTGHLSDVTATSPHLPFPLRLNGTAWGSREGFHLRQMTATLAGSQYALTGYLSSARAPTVDLYAASDHVRLDPLLRWVPRAASAVALTVGSSASVRLTAIGPAGNPDLRLQVGMQQPVSLQMKQVGTVRAGGLHVDADVVAAAKPSVRATVSGTELSIPGLKVPPITDHWPQNVALAPERPFRANVKWCGGAPVAQADLHVPLLQADRLNISNLSTQATLVGDFVRLRNLSANLLGGKLTAEAALRLKGPHQALRTRGTLRGIDLARLTELPLKLKERLSGSANATFQGQATGKGVSGEITANAADVRSAQVSVGAAEATVAVERNTIWRGAGRVTVKDLKTRQLDATRAGGLFELQDQALTLDSGFFEGPDGVGWGRGQANLDSHSLDLQVQGAELGVSHFAPLVGLKDVSGVAYAAGTVTGTTDKPNFEGKVTVFKPQVNDYACDAVVANVHLLGDTLAAKDLLVNSGSGILSGEGTISHLGAPTDQMLVSAQIQGEGISLAHAVKTAKQDWPVDGLAEFTASISGSLAKPQAQGVLKVSHANYDKIPISRAQVLFAVDPSRLTVSNLQARVLDSLLTGKLTLDFGKATQLDANLDAGEVRLQGLSPFWKSELPLGGVASVRHVWVRGPTNNLQGGAEITAPEIGVGGETIRDVNANVSLAKGQVQLQETSFQAAGGHVVLKAAYDYDANPRTVAADVSLVGTDVSDLTYLAIPIVQAADTRPADKQADLKTALRSYALRMRGMMEGTLKLSGPANSPNVVANLQGRRLVLDGRDFPDVTAQGTVNAKGVQNMSVALRQADALVSIDGDLLFDGPINANIEGSGINLAQLRPWLPKTAALDVPLGGKMGFTVVAAGQTRHPDLTASVDIANPSFAGVNFDVLSVPVATVREGQIGVDTLVIKRGEQQIVVDGQLPFSWSVPAEKKGVTERHPGLIPEGQITLGGRIEQTDLAFFLPLIDEYLRSRQQSPTAAAPPFRWATIDAKGKVDSSVSVTGTVKSPTLRGFLRIADGSLQPTQWKHPLQGIQADMALTGTGRDNLLDINTLKATYDQTHGQVTGKMYLDHLTMADFWRNRFDVKAKVSAADQGLPGGMHLTKLDGGLAMRTDEGKQVVTAEGLGFNVGEAKASITGKATLTRFRLARLADNQFDLALNVTPGRVAYGSMLNAVVGGKLQLVTSPDQRKTVLKGDWQLSDGMIGIAPVGAATTLKALSSRFPSPDLDISGGFGKKLSFRGSGMAAPLDPNPVAVRIAGTPQRPVLSGNVMARAGQASLPTANLRLSYLGVNYTVEPVPGDRGDPVGLRLRGSVQGLAETTINHIGETPIRVSVNISGALPDQVVVQASSNPALTETQIYALLGGIPFSQLPGIGSRDANLSQLVSKQFLDSLANAFRLRVFQPIEDELRRALGLSQLGITFAFDQPVSVQVGKYVLSNLLVSYERPVSSEATEYDLNVSYELPGGLRISYHNDERHDQRVEVGHNYTF